MKISHSMKLVLLVLLVAVNPSTGKWDDFFYPYEKVIVMFSVLQNLHIGAWELGSVKNTRGK